MKFMKGSSAVVVKTLEDMVELHNHNFRQVSIDIAKLYSKNRKTRTTAGLALLGVGFLFKYVHDLAKDQDKVKEEVKNLKSDYENYINTNVPSYDEVFGTDDMVLEDDKDLL